MKYSKNIIVIVNAYSTAKHLPYHFIGNGYQCIHVATPLNVGKAIAHQVQLDAKNFIQNIVMQNDSAEEIARVVTLLKAYNVKAVLAGSESSVIIADQIASHFDILKNDHHTSLVRRHKYHMIMQLEKSNMNTQQQITTDTLHELMTWYQHSELEKIILKPPLSTGSDNVYVCYNEEDIEANFGKIYAHKNLYGFTNQEVVAQEFIEGTEYVVNSVSRDGKHFISDIWRGYTQEQNGIISDDYADLVGRDTDIHAALSTYVGQMLAALGIFNGPAHSEIRHNKNGFYLIETGARLAGAIDPSALMTACGYNQIALTAETILAPSLFDTRIERAFNSDVAHMRYIYFTSTKDGIIKNIPDFSSMWQLPSMHSIYFSPQVGDKIRRASSIGDIYGYAYLINQNKHQLEQDYLQFKDLQMQFHQQLFA